MSLNATLHHRSIQPLFLLVFGLLVLFCLIFMPFVLWAAPAIFGKGISTTTISASSHVSVTGNVSAAKFIGDGSLLSGISVSTVASLDDLNDVIVSTTTRNMFVGNGTGNASASNTDNFAMGLAAMPNLTSGQYNTAIGNQALISNTIGFRNLGIGYNALAQSDGSTFFGNIAIGHQAAALAPSARTSTVIGSEAARFKTQISQTVLVGYQAGNAVGTIDNSVGVGYLALQNATASNGNTALGYRAGNILTTGSDNIVIGYQADPPANTASGRLNIGNAIYGYISNTGATRNLGGAALVGINTVTPTSNLDISGSLSTTSWTLINGAAAAIARAPLEVSGTVSATEGLFGPFNSSGQPIVRLNASGINMRDGTNALVMQIGQSIGQQNTFSNRSVFSNGLQVSGQITATNIVATNNLAVSGIVSGSSLNILNTAAIASSTSTGGAAVSRSEALAVGPGMTVSFTSATCTNSLNGLIRGTNGVVGSSGSGGVLETCQTPGGQAGWYQYALMIPTTGGSTGMHAQIPLGWWAQNSNYFGIGVGATGRGSYMYSAGGIGVMVLASGRTFIGGMYTPTQNPTYNPATTLEVSGSIAVAPQNRAARVSPTLWVEGERAGVGTATPTTVLDVSGTLRVGPCNGTMVSSSASICSKAASNTLFIHDGSGNFYPFLVGAPVSITAF